MKAIFFLFLIPILVLAGCCWCKKPDQQAESPEAGPKIASTGASDSGGSQTQPSISFSSSPSSGEEEDEALVASPIDSENFGAIPPELIKEGHSNAQLYCGVCHLVPEPDLLDRETWLASVLPAMAPGGSRFTPPVELIATPAEDRMEGPLEMARQKAPAVTEDDWQSIMAYYDANSLETLESPRISTPVKFGLPHFEVEFPETLPAETPGTTAIRIDERREQILVGSTDPDMFLVFDSNLEVLQQAPLSSPPTWFQYHPKPGPDGRRLSITMAGKLERNDDTLGSITIVEEQPGIPVYSNPQPILSELRRPVHTQFADLDGDALSDPIVSQFGDTLGSLTWHQADALGAFREHLLIPRAGALMTRVVDFDKDGDPDILALMTQGKEGIYLLINDGKGRFEIEPLIELPPVFGSSSFELMDWNGDDLPDLLLTCGDNADFSPILKPYHGIYIYLNRGDEGFEQAYFRPMNGAYHVEARDFDEDGDTDLACISQFPDLRSHPADSFLYLRNEGGAGDFEFTISTFEEATDGRWLVMDSGDVDGDGDIDLVLGNFLMGNMSPDLVPERIQRKWQGPGPHFCLLRNTLF